MVTQGFKVGCMGVSMGEGSACMLHECSLPKTSKPHYGGKTPNASMLDIIFEWRVEGNIALNCNKWRVKVPTKFCMLGLTFEEQAQVNKSKFVGPRVASKKSSPRATSKIYRLAQGPQTKQRLRPLGFHVCMGMGWPTAHKNKTKGPSRSVISTLI